jgi:hypothetical protein
MSNIIAIQTRFNRLTARLELSQHRHTTGNEGDPPSWVTTYPLEFYTDSCFFC